MFPRISEFRKEIVRPVGDSLPADDTSTGDPRWDVIGR